MTDRITLDPAAIERLIRSAALEDLRHETTPDVRERSIGQAETALNALCGLSDYVGSDGVWDVLATLDRRQLLTFATFAVGELAQTDYAPGG
ncbi:unannotated protein [freshwater metagenome]|uniref:Unannotated protein n=1 Tax=freshwater metagenome TaxID=449393 RepID=A0A6J7HPT6_9ZZZZ|nr:hypothetical protein [Actinomycetota bacterium]